jgi:hypothetical protein
MPCAHIPLVAAGVGVVRFDPNRAAAGLPREIGASEPRPFQDLKECLRPWRLGHYGDRHASSHSTRNIQLNLPSIEALDARCHICLGHQGSFIGQGNPLIA